MVKPLVRVTIHDCEVQTFRAGGKGGQNQNKRDSGVRVIHNPSGARAESREYREQLKNKRAAFLRMVNTKEFQLWLKIETSKALGCYEDIEKEVDRQMNNVRIEYKDDEGNWYEVQ